MEPSIPDHDSTTTTGAACGPGNKSSSAATSATAPNLNEDATSTVCRPRTGGIENFDVLEWNHRHIGQLTSIDRRKTPGPIELHDLLRSRSDIDTQRTRRRNGSAR
jgi:hypothetical protein